MIAPEHGRYGMIGTSPAMVKVYDAVERVCNSKSTVYIAGPSGTGKELVAKALHEQGKRIGKPFVAVNVNEFGDDALLETNLFGVEARVATGVSRREGIFVHADKGTLFLDEIAEMSPAMQAKLLRVIQEEKVVPVGGDYSTPTPFDVRIVAASSKPLEEYVKAGDFRSDLYYRLRVVYVQLPPLRERGSDACLLADHFLQMYNAKEEKHVHFHESVYTWLSEQAWPGNVRELENTIRGAVAWTRKAELQPKDFLMYKLERGEAAVDTIQQPGKQIDALALVRTYFKEDSPQIRAAVLECLERFGGNVSKLARILGVDRKTFHRHLDRLGIDRSRFGLSTPGEVAPLTVDSTDLAGRDFLRTYFSVNTDDPDRVKRELETLLEEFEGNVGGAAISVGIGRTRLLYQLNKWGIDPARFRKSRA